MRIFRSRRAVAVLASLCLLGVPAGAAAAESRTIYSSLPFVGTLRADAEDVRDGELLALQQAGARVGEMPVLLASLDSGRRSSGFWDPSRVAANARRAAADPSTIAYIGEFNSGASAISIPVLNEAGVPQVSPSNEYVGLTRRGGADLSEPDKYYPTGTRTYVRVAPADHLQAAAIARSMGLNGVRSVFLVDDSELYGRGLTDMVRARLRDRGIRLAGRAHLSSPGRDAATIARRIRRSRPDAMFFGGITDNGAVSLWREVHGASPGLQLYGGDGVADRAFTRAIPRGAAARTRITLQARPARTHPAAGQLFLAAFRAQFGRAPGRYAIYGYEAMSLVLDAIGRAGPAGPAGDDREAVRRRLFATRDRDSVLGRYSIDRFGDTTLRAYGGYRISRHGNLSYERTIDTGG